jgi:hypothetical protein
MFPANPSATAHVSAQGSTLHPNPANPSPTPPSNKCCKPKSPPALFQQELPTLYFVFLPPGTQVDQGGSKSCHAFCGYHDATSDHTFYAVLPYPGCTGCEGGLAVPDALTSTSSHELCEAITDPVPGTGWYDDANGEIGDICAWKTKTLGSYTVQLEWSNSADACV